MYRQQNEKMNLLKSALKEREKDVEEKNARRIDDIKIRKTEQKNRLIAKIQRMKIKGNVSSVRILSWNNDSSPEKINEEQKTRRRTRA